MREDGSIHTRNTGFLARQWVTCISAYGIIWACTFNLLWFLESNGLKSLRYSADFGRVLLSLVWNALCPDWPFFAVGLVLGLLTCVCLPKICGAVKSSLLWSSLPAAAILAIFGFTTSGFLPALMAMAASYLAATVVARTWQQPLFSVPFSGRFLAPRKVIVVLAWLLGLSIPFRLFELLGEAWSRSWPTKISETNPTPSPNGAYVATIHNVDPNVNDYSEVIIRPRHTFLDLFTGFSASTRLDGVDRIEWLGQRTLRVSGDFRPHTEWWHDVRILYNDTADPEERRERDALTGGSEGR